MVNFLQIGTGVALAFPNVDRETDVNIVASAKNFARDLFDIRWPELDSATDEESAWDARVRELRAEAAEYVRRREAAAGGDMRGSFWGKTS